MVLNATACSSVLQCSRTNFISSKRCFAPSMIVFLYLITENIWKYIIWNQIDGGVRTFAVFQVFIHPSTFNLNHTITYCETLQNTLKYTLLMNITSRSSIVITYSPRCSGTLQNSLTILEARVSHLAW